MNESLASRFTRTLLHQFLQQIDFFSLKCFSRRRFWKFTKLQAARLAMVLFLAKRRPNPIFNWSPVDREAYEFSVCTYIGNKNKFDASGFSNAPLSIASRFSSCYISWRMRVCAVTNIFFPAHVESYSYYLLWTQGRKSKRLPCTPINARFIQGSDFKLSELILTSIEAILLQILS